MTDKSPQDVATEKLISIFNGAPNGSSQQLEAIAALGRVGGVAAAKKLESIYNGASKGSKQQLTAIRALGEVGRTS